MSASDIPAGPRFDFPVVDIDVHIHEATAELAPFAEGTLRQTLELHRGPDRWLDVPGYAPQTIYDPPLGAEPLRPPHTIGDADALRADLDRRGIDAAVISTGKLLAIGTRADFAYPVGIMRAYNRYLTERWLDPTRGIFGALLAVSQDPRASADEITRHADRPGVAAVCLPMASVYPLWGHRQYDPIYAAAEAAGLPVIMQGFTQVHPTFPYQLDQFDTALAKQALSKPFGAMANLVSLATTGTFARFPRLKVVFTECGLGWLPYVTGRLDAQYPYLRQELPFTDEPPSAAIRRAVYLTTQQLEIPPDPRRLPILIEAANLQDRLLFGTDWPHYDATSLDTVLSLPLPSDWHRPILSDTARQVFRLEGLRVRQHVHGKA